jgi:hypothetical protein
MIRFRNILALAALMLLAACGQPSTGNDSFGAVANQPQDHASGDHSQAAPSAAASIVPVLATSELVVGPNRLALGILQDNVPIEDADQTDVHVRFFRLNGNQATPAGEEDAVYYGEGLGDRGTFIVHPTFDAPGAWGMEVETTRPGQNPITQRMQLEVKAESSAPIIGEDAPRSKTPTAADVADLKLISSDATPDPRLHQMSVEQAVTSGKPSLILFATPGYCQTAVCGPGVDVLETLVDQFGNKINPVHVEVYQLPYDNGKMVPAMREWGLQTEPWLFLVDKTGKIAGRYEGGITAAELEPEVAKLVE